jgi:hypothetical protein
MGCNHNGTIGGNWFRLGKTNGNDRALSFYTDRFNIDDYYIYKATKRFREVEHDEFLKFRYSCYMLFNKQKWNKEFLDSWILWLKEYPNSQHGFVYFNKPLPPFPPDKITIH